MAQMNPYNIPMKNLTLICGKQSLEKNWGQFTIPHSNSDSLELIFGMPQFQLHRWNWGVNSNSNSTELGGFQGIPHV